MSTQKVDYLNIGMMLVSFGAALVLPFKLFLFSYVVLGPIHYLTEIGWLHQRNYFETRGRTFSVLLAITGLLVVTHLTAIVLSPDSTTPILKSWLESKAGPLLEFLVDKSPALMLTAFSFALAMIIFQDIQKKLLLMAGGLIAGYFLRNQPSYEVIFVWFLPTIIHVCLFTGIFILAGALRSNSRPGYVSVGVFAICSSGYFLWPQSADAYMVEEGIRQIYDDGDLLTLNVLLHRLFTDAPPVADAGLGLNIQRFIAFAYTYHYLNWFSKINIIRWYQQPRKWIVLSLCLWIAAIALYLYNFRVGLITLLFFSLLHVILEFPLNHKSVIDTCRLLKLRLAGDPA